MSDSDFSQWNTRLSLFNKVVIVKMIVKLSCALFLKSYRESPGVSFGVELPFPLTTCFSAILFSSPSIS